MTPTLEVPSSYEVDWPRWTPAQYFSVLGKYFNVSNSSLIPLISGATFPYIKVFETTGDCNLVTYFLDVSLFI